MWRNMDSDNLLFCRRACECKRMDQMINPPIKEQETGFWEMTLGRLPAGVVPILKFLILRLMDNHLTHLSDLLILGC
jgi:hypothetical protein